MLVFNTTSLGLSLAAWLPLSALCLSVAAPHCLIAQGSSYSLSAATESASHDTCQDWWLKCSLTHQGEPKHSTAWVESFQLNRTLFFFSTYNIFDENHLVHDGLCFLQEYRQWNLCTRRQNIMYLCINVCMYVRMYVCIISYNYVLLSGACKCCKGVLNSRPIVQFHFLSNNKFTMRSAYKETTIMYIP